MKIRTILIWLFLLLISVLSVAVGNRAFRVDYEALDTAWLDVEVTYIDRIDTVIDAREMLSSTDGSSLPEVDFARRAKYKLRFESDLAPKIEAVNTFERSLAEYFNELEHLSSEGRVSGLERYDVMLSLTQSGSRKVRDTFNLQVRRYNTLLSLFPRNWFAPLFGYDKQALLSMNFAGLSL